MGGLVGWRMKFKLKKFIVLCLCIMFCGLVFLLIYLFSRLLKGVKFVGGEFFLVVCFF